MFVVKGKNKNKSDKVKSQFIIIGSLLIVIGICLIGIKLFLNISENYREKEAISKFYDKQENLNVSTEVVEKQLEDTTSKETKLNVIEYIAILKIPKINLERGIVAKDSKYNNVDRNIQILKESSYPDEDKGNVILAAHSGTGRIAFFKDLDKLEIGDEAIILYKDKTYIYKVKEIETADKTGKITVTKDKDVTALTLITCKPNSETEQIVIICELYKEE